MNQVDKQELWTNGAILTYIMQVFACSKANTHVYMECSRYISVYMYVHTFLLTNMTHHFTTLVHAHEVIKIAIFVEISGGFSITTICCYKKYHSYK